MAKWRILITAPYMLPIIDEYADVFARNDAEYVKADVEERLEEDALLDIVGEYHGVIAGDDRFTRKVFEAAKNLKVLSKWGTGIDSYDQQAAADHGVAITRTVDAFTEPVSDSVLGHILNFARNLAAMDRHMKNGVWEKIPGRALNESTIGVIGVGATGSAVLRKAKPFDARLLGTDPAELQPGHIKTLGVEMVSLDTLLAESDFVCVQCDLNETSHHLMNGDAFRKMKNTAFLINCARGPIVDEAALVRALQNGDIAGAGLDVFELEPLPADSPLKEMDNVFMAPHNSNSSPKAWRNVHQRTLDAMFGVLNPEETSA